MQDGALRTEPVLTNRKFTLDLSTRQNLTSHHPVQETRCFEKSVCYRYKSLVTEGGDDSSQKIIIIEADKIFARSFFFRSQHFFINKFFDLTGYDGIILTGKQVSYI